MSNATLEMLKDKGMNAEALSFVAAFMSGPLAHMMSNGFIPMMTAIGIRGENEHPRDGAMMVFLPAGFGATNTPMAMEIVRLLTAAADAPLSIYASEVWMSTNPSVRPSEDENRTEGVMMIVSTDDGDYNISYDLKRDEDGNMSELVLSSAIDFKPEPHMRMRYSEKELYNPEVQKRVNVMRSMLPNAETLKEAAERTGHNPFPNAAPTKH